MPVDSRMDVLQTLCDETLYTRFAAGEDAAYAVLYRRYAARLMGYLHSILGPADAGADDVFQETFLRLYRERERGSKEPVRNVGGWLFRVGRNLALNHLRSQKYLAPLPTVVDESMAVTVEEAHADLFGEERSDQELIRAVNAVVETLPASLREVFVLREVNGMSYEETAAIAGCSEEAARMRLSRARSAIRRALQYLLVDDE